MITVFFKPDGIISYYFTIIQILAYISPVCMPNSPDPISGPVTLAGWGQAYDGY
jgi:hypothetical protein